MVVAEYEFESPNRRYMLWLGRDLLGDLQLIRKWQGKKTKRGGQKIDFVLDESAGLKKVRQIAGTRLRHGYSVTFMRHCDVDKGRVE